jgi:hypothetical protein
MAPLDFLFYPSTMRRHLLACVLFALPLFAQAPQSLSPRVVAYHIDARLDAAKKTVDATETLTYRNLTGQPLTTFPFHLYLNAFQPQSTVTREIRRGDADFELKPEERGSISIRKFEVDGIGDLTSQLRFIHPDDDNSNDHTVAEIKLPAPIAPGATVTFRIAFRDHLPQVTMRTGYRRNFYLVAQWFPKVGVFWRGAWNCHQFHANTEFFADFGTYDVNVTVPRNFITGSSGDEMSVVNNSDGTKTVSYHGEDIHDFAWTADPNYRVVEDHWQGSAANIRIRLLMQPGHLNQSDRYMSALKGTLDRFDRWYGSYPYDRITVVDPAADVAEDAGGMEYPTFITAGTSWLMPRGIRLAEDVVEHEFGHQYWYGMVASNEFEEAWMDEGINTYTEFKIMNSLYGPNSMLDYLGSTTSVADSQHRAYANTVRNDPITRKAWQFLGGGSYGSLTYGKTGAALLSLEAIIGEPTLRRAIHTYFSRYRFTHPTGEDFFKTINEVSGQDLRWFWDQAFYGTEVLDYEILSARSEPVDPDAKPADTIYRGDVVVHRKGDFIFPTDIEMRFDDGSRIREHWDGRDRWIRYSYQKKAKLISAEVDPDHRVALDVDFFNNSKLVQPNTGAKRKISTYWMVVAQFLSALGSWLV